MMMAAKWYTLTVVHRNGTDHPGTNYDPQSDLAEIRVSIAKERGRITAKIVYNSIIALCWASHRPLCNYNYDHYRVDRLTMLSISMRM